MSFGEGLYEKRVLASVKLSSMEKYGFAYQEDLDLIRAYLDDVEVTDLGKGKFRIKTRLNEFEVSVRNYNPNSNKRIRNIEGEREGWVSVWDVSKH